MSDFEINLPKTTPADGRPVPKKVSNKGKFAEHVNSCLEKSGMKENIDRSAVDLSKVLANKGYVKEKDYRHLEKSLEPGDIVLNPPEAQKAWGHHRPGKKSEHEIYKPIPEVYRHP